MRKPILAGSALATAVLAATAPAMAHHGFGLFQMNTNAEWSGTLTKMELVNPHSYMYFDTTAANGDVLHMRCEMRAATLIKRMGWSIEMFKPGAHVELKGHPHRDDPEACYIEEFTLDDGPTVNRNQLMSSAGKPVDTSNRELRLPSGEPNISGDWAVEQAILTIPPSGGNGSLVPVSVREQFAKGEITLEQIRAKQPAPPKVVYTDAGKAAADAFRTWSVEDNPRLSCKPTSIIFDWGFDWPVNRITQTTVNGEKVIDIDYGLFSFTRRIHLDAEHPATVTPSYSGHSIGKWEGDTLVVDTIGFEPGVLAPPIRNSDQMHIVERFTMDPATFQLRRDYTVTDPVYLAEPYTSADVVLLSDVPFEKQPCVELTPEFEGPAQ